MALQNLGEVSIATESFPAALAYYKNALVNAEIIDQILGKAIAHNGIGKALAGLEEREAATQSYHQAMELYADLGAEWGITETRTSLAQIALAQDDEESALVYVNAILDFLEEDKILGFVVGPSECYFTCTKAREVLETTYNELQEQAAKIKDEELQRSFLENVPWNRDLVRLWEEKRYQRINP
jgi:tetratricopeptide (TPR) repeat protein